MDQTAEDQFFLFIVDDDQKRFTISGPMTDVLGWLKKVEEQKHQGKNIRLFSTPMNAPQEELAADFSKHTGYTLSPTPIVE